MADSVSAAKSKWPLHPETLPAVSWMPPVVKPHHEGGIPDVPALVVAPLGLVGQWISESHKAFTRDSVAVLPYISMSLAAKKTFWSITAPTAAQQVGGWGNVIIIASTDVS
jgi:hypothetical protein